MKILMLIDSLEVGGAETHVEILADELASRGHEITVTSGGGKLHQKLQKGKIKCIHLPLLQTKKRHKNNVSFILHFLPLRYTISGIISDTKPDIVHAHTRKTALLAHYVCKKHKIPLVVTAHALFSMKFPKNILSKWGDGTIAVSEDIKNHLIEYGDLHSQIEVISNGVKSPQKTLARRVR